MIRVEVRIRMTRGGEVTRHYTVPGFQVALCGRLTLRPPTADERRSHRCQACAVALARMEGKS